MATPSNTTITIDGTKLNAFSTHVSLASMADHTGIPMMGSLSCGMEFAADMHDTQNVPFASVQKFFDLANIPTRDKVKDIKLEFWLDENPPMRCARLASEDGSAPGRLRAVGEAITCCISAFIQHSTSKTITTCSLATKGAVIATPTAISLARPFPATIVLFR
jgi:hypothetical protein